MIVASLGGLIELSCEYADPMLCTYTIDGALEPNEIKAKRSKWQTRKPQSERLPVGISIF